MVWGRGIVPNIHALNSISARKNYLEKKTIKNLLPVVQAPSQNFPEASNKQLTGIGLCSVGARATLESIFSTLT